MLLSGSNFGFPGKFSVGFFLCFVIFARLEGCDGQISSGNDVDFDFSKYNPNDKSTHVLQKEIEVLGDFPSTIINVANVSGEVGFFVAQVHSYVNVIEFSQDEKTFIRGTNLGLVQVVNATDSLPYQFFVKTDGKNNASVLVILVAYNSDAPIPGGCSMTFPTQISPYQLVNYTEELIKVDIQAPLIKGHICEDHLGVIDMYHLYLEEWNFEKDEYFSKIQNLLTVEDIVTNGRKVPEPHGATSLRRYYNSYAGTGSVFVAVATFGNFSSAYVPAVSYGCDVSDGVSSCVKTTSYMWAWLLAILLFTGLFICFLGHEFLRFTLFYVGLIVGDFFIFVFLSPLDLTEGESVLVFGILGVIMGGAWVVIWSKFARPVLSVMLSFVLTGFLVASILFYCGLGDIHVYQYDLNYWGTMFCITLTATLMLTFVTLPGNILACSFIGAYTAVVPIDHYIGSNLQYIIITTARRATVNNFNIAVIDPPYQGRDIGMTFLWLALTTAGAIVQWRRNKGRAPFPPPDNYQRPSLTERTPLISHSSAVYA